MQNDTPTENEFEAIGRDIDDLKILSDNAFALRSTIDYKLEVENMIGVNQRMMVNLKKNPWWTFLHRMISPLSSELWLLRRSAEYSRLMLDIETKTKQKLIYHNNELALEDSFKEIYEQMAQRFDSYFSQLRFVFNNNSMADDKLPMEDVKALIEQFEHTPPKANTEKLSFYLSMENALYRCKHPDKQSEKK